MQFLHIGCSAVAALLWHGATLAQIPHGDSAQRGSLLVLPNIEVRLSPAGDVIQDTFIELSNNYPGDVNVYMFWVNGDPPLPADFGTGERAHPGWNSVDTFVSLTQEQPVYWSARTGGGLVAPWLILDPGLPLGRPDPEGSPDRILRGYILAFAVDAFGAQISWNHLSAHATLVNYVEHTAWRYGAVAFQADSNLPIGSRVGEPGAILLDGAEYEACPNQLLLQFLANGTPLISQFSASPTIADTDLTLLPMILDHDQEPGTPVTTTAVFDVWDMNETHFGGINRCVTYWDQALVSSYAAPNFLATPLLTTDIGKARIDGRATANCPGSVDAPLLGVAGQYLDFAPTPEANRDIAGVTLVGDGAQPGIIHYETAVPPDERRPARAAAATSAPMRAPGSSDRPKTNSAGSMLIFADVELRWDDQGNLIRDTFIELTNDFPSDVTVRLYFVNGDEPLPPLERAGVAVEPGWNHLCGTVDLTHDQPTYWSAATGLPAGVPAFIDLDADALPPGRPAGDGTTDRVLRGYALAWAVNTNGEEIHWNHLSGMASVVDVSESSVWSYNATALAALGQGGTVAHGEPTGTPFALHFDGVEFAALHAYQFMSFIAEGSAALDGALASVSPANNLTLMAVPTDLRASATGPLTTAAQFTVWNENETKWTGIVRCVTCWEQEFLNTYGVPNHFLRPNLQTDAGRAMIFSTTNVACPNSTASPLLGLLRTQLSFNAGAGFAEAGGALRGGQASQPATLLVDATCGEAFQRLGDTDDDGDVDLPDLATLQRCFDGNPQALPLGCSPAQFDRCDADDDSDVDVTDYRLIQLHLVGPR